MPGKGMSSGLTEFVNPWAQHLTGLPHRFPTSGIDWHDGITDVWQFGFVDTHLTPLGLAPLKSKDSVLV